MAPGPVVADASAVPPWQTATGRRQWRKQPLAQDTARLAAEIASALHRGQSYTSSGQHNPKTQQTLAPRQRQAKWGCPECETRNFLHRGSCRACGAAWRVGLVHFPAGAPAPNPPAAKPAPSTPVATHSAAPLAGSTPAAAEASAAADVKAAEAAVAAARAAQLPADVVARLDAEVASRRAAIDAQKPLPKRLQEATQQAANAKAAHEKAEASLLKAQDAVRLAKAARDEAEATLATVTAELSAPAAAQALAAAAPAALAALNELMAQLTAVDQAQIPQGLAEAMRAAQAATTAPPPVPAAAAAAANGAAADADMQAAGGKRLSEGEADALLHDLEGMDQAQKRQRLRECLAAAGASSTGSVQVRPE